MQSGCRVGRERQVMEPETAVLPGVVEGGHTEAGEVSAHIPKAFFNLAFLLNPV